VILALALMIAGGVMWGGWVWCSDRSHRDAIMQIELEMANGRFAIAARSLTKLLARQPDSGELAMLLARCEQEQGRFEPADKALSRVAPGSMFAHRATLARMRLAHDRGQFAAAEQIVNTAADDSRNDRSHTRFLLVPIFSQLGRKDEAARLIEQRWEHLNETGEGASEPAIDLVRMHIELHFKPNPVDSVRAYLDQAARLTDGDDRVWLGRANLATRTGAFDEARRWLDACQLRRPVDVPVWRARLNWAIATNRIDDVHRALKHLPADDSTTDLVPRLRAWLAARRGDPAAERRGLERLLADDPADLAALDRCARLAQQAGQLDQATLLLDKKTAIERIRARYEKLFDRNQPIRDAEEMASLAEQLGRSFEARAFLTVAIAEEPERDDLRRNLKRLIETPKPAAARGRTLAELIAHDQGDLGANRVTPSS
jgi:thioredoxin-like negative regulator of GroEL